MEHFKKSPSKIRHCYFTIFQVLPSISVFQASHQFMTKVSALEWTVTDYVSQVCNFFGNIDTKN